MSGSGSRELAEFVVDQLAPPGGVSLHRYFGGWALRRDGRQFAMVMDTLYLRVAEDVPGDWAARGSRPFTYQAGGRTVTVRRYHSVPDDLLDDWDRLLACVHDLTSWGAPA
ncbi:TfoX/Sxy family protein [Frankia sp. QA3]|uniref:TfoX/Sxy family protein n=1 Tax=Frankia sp. QA3 TaxID=710111 RepID=UPI000269C682|nr:TfoX/Sxy family protein [Frankia sp. QA3]EIV94021.1 regulator of competence-specific genes [Frankia sp. QA3]